MPTPVPARLLVIDDDADMIEMYEALFPEVGYEVSTVNSLDKALALLEIHWFDLILTDLFGPYTQEALHSIEPLLRHAWQTPVLVVTARQIPSEACDGLPIRALFLKPFDLETLLEAVARHLQKAKTEDSDP